MTDNIPLYLLQTVSRVLTILTRLIYIYIFIKVTC